MSGSEYENIIPSDFVESFRHPTPVTPARISRTHDIPIDKASRIVDEMPKDNQTQLLREIRDYLKYLTTKKYYIEFPPSQVKIFEYASWLNYSALGAYLVQRTETAFSISCDLQFMAALTDSASIQSGVPIQAEPYELFGFVNFFIRVNSVALDISSYGYQDLLGALQGATGWGILTKTYDLSKGYEPSYIKPGDYFEVGYSQLQVPLRAVAKVGHYERSLLVDKTFLQDAGIVRL